MHGFIYLEGDCVKILAYISDLNKNFSPRTTYTEEHLFVFCPHNQYPSNKDGLIAYSSPNTRSLIPSLIIITGIIMGGSVLPHEMLDPHSWTVELLWCLSFACTFPFSSCMSIRFFLAIYMFVSWSCFLIKSSFLPYMCHEILQLRSTKYKV